MGGGRSVRPAGLWPWLRREKEGVRQEEPCTAGHSKVAQLKAEPKELAGEGEVSWEQAGLVPRLGKMLCWT